MIISALLSILTPVATAIITKYTTKKLSPVIDKINQIELDTPQKKNEEKLNNVMRVIWSSPDIMNFFAKCGWKGNQVIVIVNFCVLMVKKPLHDEKTKWNDDDYKLIFEFLKVIASRWVTLVRGKR